MLATSSLAIFLMWGMLAFNALQPVSSSEQKITCQPAAEDNSELTRPDREKNQQLVFELQKINTDISKSLKEYSSQRLPAQREQLIKFIQERKKAFIEAIRQNPDAAIFTSFPSTDLSALSSLTKNCVEQYAEQEGTLEVVIADYFDENFSIEQYTLITDASERIVLHPARGLKDTLISGTQVKVKGKKIDNDMIFDGTSSLSDNSPLGGIDVLSQPGNPPVLGDQKTLVLLVNFQNVSEAFVSLDDAKRIMDDFRSHTYENSYHKAWTSGVIEPNRGADVFGWYEIPLASTCSWGSVLNAAAQRANEVNESLDFTQYSRLMVVAPFSCGWGGIASTDKIIYDTPDGRVLMSVGAVTSFVPLERLFLTIGHEIGHGFGNNHDSRIFCGNEIFSSTPNICQNYEYGGYSIMGNRYPAYYSALMREYLGWLDSESDIIDVQQDGTYIFRSLDSLEAGVKAMKIKRYDGRYDDYLNLTAYSPTGFNQTIPLSHNLFSGTLIQTYDYPTAQGYTGEVFYFNKPFLVVAHPTIFNTSAAAIFENEMFIDPLSGIAITQLLSSPNYNIVDIRRLKEDTEPPEVIFSPVPPTEIAIEISPLVTLHADAADASGIDRVEFYYSNFLNAGKVLISVDYSEPYEATLDISRFWPANITLSARAYDNAGKNLGIDGIEGNFKDVVAYTEIVNHNFQRPLDIEITKIQGIIAGSLNNYYRPYNSLIYVGAPIDIEAAPLSFRIENIARAEFYIDNSLFTTRSIVGNARFFSARLVPATQGQHILRVKAIGINGEDGWSKPVNIIIDLTGPTLSVNSPANNSVISGRVTLSANAEDNFEIASVAFYLADDVANRIPIGVANHAPYQVLWDTRKVTNGAHTLDVEARDLASQSNRLSMNISVSNPEIRRPELTIVEPENNSRITGVTAIRIGGENVDQDFVVIFFKDDEISPFAYDITPPYEAELNTANLSVGSHALQVKAYDPFGNMYESERVTVTIGATFIRGDSNADGTVNITDPAYLLNHLFKGGPLSPCDDAADANDDGSLDISDAVRTLLYLFGEQGIQLAAPGPTTPGPDPTADGLGCAVYAGP